MSKPMMIRIYPEDLPLFVAWRTCLHAYCHLLDRKEMDRDRPALNILYARQNELAEAIVPAIAGRVDYGIMQGDIVDPFKCAERTVA